MKIYLDNTELLSDLKKRGFINDFHLVGNDLFWIQKKGLLRVGAFDILEYYKIIEPKKNTSEHLILGILAPYHNVKGILIKQCKNNNRKISPIILKKLKDLFTGSSEHCESSTEWLVCYHK